MGGEEENNKKRVKVVCTADDDLGIHGYQLMFDCSAGAGGLECTRNVCDSTGYLTDEYLSKGPVVLTYRHTYYPFDIDDDKIVQGTTTGQMHVLLEKRTPEHWVRFSVPAGEEFPKAVCKVSHAPVWESEEERKRFQREFPALSKFFVGVETSEFPAMEESAQQDETLKCEFYS